MLTPVYRLSQHVDFMRIILLLRQFPSFREAMCQKLYTFEGEIGAGRYGIWGDK